MGKKKTYRLIPLVLLLQLLLGYRVMLPALHGLYHQATETHSCADASDISALCSLSNAVETQQKNTQTTAQAITATIFDFISPALPLVPQPTSVAFVALSEPSYAEEHLPLLAFAFPTPPPQK